METKEFIEVINPMIEGLKKEAATSAQKHEDAVKEINADLEKKNVSIGEIKLAIDKFNEAITEIKAENNRLGAGNQKSKDFAGEFGDLVEKNFDKIQAVKNGGSFQMKTVGDMTISANLTGSAVATYDLTPAVRGRRKVHFRDLVSVIPSATGIFKFYRQNSPVGEGSFGVQTEGSAKAQIDFDNTEVTVTVDTIAGFTRISKQMLRDLPFMQAFVPSELQESYYRDEDNKFINTLMAATAAYSTTATVYAEKLIEWASVLLGRDYDPNAFVTTAANWATLLSTKPADYSIPGGVTITPMGDVAVAGIPVKILNGMTGTKTFVGDWSRLKIVQAAGLNINFFEQDADNVTKNLITVRAEAEVALANLRPDAFLYV